MRAILLCQSLLVLAFFASATHGRTHYSHRYLDNDYGDMEGLDDTRFGHHGYPLHQNKPSPQLLKALLSVLLEPQDPALQSNALDDMGLDPDDLAEYSAAATISERPRESSGKHHLSNNYEYRNHHEEVCETIKGWKTINETVDIDGHEVIIVNPQREQQSVYTFECAAPCAACKGIEETVQSRCKMRYSYVQMYHRRKYYPNADVIWGYVEVPSHCACELIPHQADTGCFN